MNKRHYYQKRINKAAAYINDHLADDIHVSHLASISCFSVYHFQRIYKAIQNETPYETLLRLRLEKSIFLLKHRSHMKVLDIALECGFSSAENFSRQFKVRFNFTASHFKNNKKLHNSRIHQETFLQKPDNNPLQSSTQFCVTVDRLKAIPLVVNRAIFGEDGSVLVEKYQELIKWAKQNNLDYTGKLNRFGMSIDDPNVTPKNKYRYDFALASKKDIKNTAFETRVLPHGFYATLHCKGDIITVTNAWDYLYKTWLPESQYTPLHFPAIEEFIQGPEQIGWEQFNIKCRIPIIKIKGEKI